MIDIKDIKLNTRETLPRRGGGGGGGSCCPSEF